MNDEHQIIRTYRVLKLPVSHMMIIPVAYREKTMPNGHLRLGFGVVEEARDPCGRVVPREEYEKDRPEDQKVYEYSYRYNKELERKTLKELPEIDGKALMEYLAKIRNGILLGKRRGEKEGRDD